MMEIENIRKLILKIQTNKTLIFSYEELSIQITRQSDYICLSACVFSDENYLPQRVRAFVENYCFDLDRSFLIDEENFEIIYNQQFRFSLEAFYLFDQVDYFVFETRKWKAIFDDLSSQDLIFIHQS